jgi:hypothetical protein
VIETPLDAAFFAIAGAIMAITALRPQWTIYALTYGRPERAKGHENGIMFMRICAAVAAVSIAAAFLVSSANS